jgi:hypothetical protein
MYHTRLYNSAFNSFIHLRTRIENISNNLNSIINLLKSLTYHTFSSLIYKNSKTSNTKKNCDSFISIELIVLFIFNEYIYIEVHYRAIQKKRRITR